MLKGKDTNDRINSRIHPVAKARIIAECERRSTRGRIYSLTDYLNDSGFALPSLAEDVERTLESRYAVKREEGEVQDDRPAGAVRIPAVVA